MRAIGLEERERETFFGRYNLQLFKRNATRGARGRTKEEDASRPLASDS